MANTIIFVSRGHTQYMVFDFIDILKNFRRLVIRYEYHAYNFLGLVQSGYAIILYYFGFFEMASNRSLIPINLLLTLFMRISAFAKLSMAV